MRPLTLTAEGYRSFAELEFRFPDGAVAIVGPNGSGKSSLIGAVELALFGPRGRSLEPYARRGSDSLRLELVFEHGGDEYRVRRAWKSGKTTLDLEKFETYVDIIGPQGGPTIEEWVPLTLGNAADTQAHLEKIIGLSRSTFLASAYLAQRESDSFTAAQPRDRKRVLADALALDDWAVSADAVAADRRAAEKQMAELDARIVVFTEQQARAVELEAEADRLAELMGAARELAEQAEAELVGAADRMRAAEQAEAEWQNRQQALEVAAARLAPLKETAGQAALAKDRAAAVQGDISRLEGLAVELDTLQTERARLAEQDRARTEAIAAKQRLAVEATRLESRLAEHHAESVAIAAKLAALAQADAVCDRCGQHVADRSLDRARDSLLAEVGQINATVSRGKLELAALDAKIAEQIAALPEPVVGLAQVDARLREIAGAPAELAAARERLAGIQTLIERATEPAFTQELERAEHDHAVAARQAASAVRPEGVDMLRAAAVSVKAAADVARQKHTNAQVEHARLVAQVDQLEAVAAEHEAALAQREQLRDELDVLAGLEKAFGRDGVPAWIVEAQAIPAIEAEANRVLARLGGKVERVELRTERETKKGEARDALDIVCWTAEGDRELATFSGGEQARAEIACALGLARLLGSRRGADLRFLALDEPPGLDMQGTEALAEILKELAQGGVDTVLLASHDPGLRDQFDQSILVEADAGGSRVLA